MTTTTTTSAASIAARLREAVKRNADGSRRADAETLAGMRAALDALAPRTKVYVSDILPGDVLDGFAVVAVARTTIDARGRTIPGVAVELDGAPTITMRGDSTYTVRRPTEPTRYVRIISRDFDAIGDAELLYTADAPECDELRTMEPDDFDADDGLTAVDVLARYLLDETGAAWLEPDISPVSVEHAPSWFGGRDDGECGTETSVHFKGSAWTPEERAAVWARYGR